MRRAIILVLTVFCVAQLSARDVININRDWKFFSSNEGSGDLARTVNLPHTWNTDALAGNRFYFRGVGNYTKEINVPLEWRNKRVFIRFNGAGNIANLMVNGRHVGEHRGAYTAFTFELTSLLKYGESNLLWVIVNNSPQLDLLPTAGDINMYGGLYRDVELIVTEPSIFSVTDFSSDGIYLNQKKISKERAEVDAVVKINGLRDRQLTVNIAVLTPQNDTVEFQTARLKVPVSGSGSLTLPIVIDNPTLWDGVKNPYMYRVLATLMDEQILCDSISIPLGVRFFAVDPKKGFMLNGEPYRLKGVVYYEDRAVSGPAITPYQVVEDLDMIAEIGANAVRAAAYPHNRKFYQECDRRGIIVWSDLPFLGPAYLADRGYMAMERFHENGRNQLSEMIYQGYNHPSIVMWGLFSEQTLRGDDPTNYIKELNSITMNEDPSRMSVAASNQDGSMNFVTDLIVWNHNFGWKEGLPSDIEIWLEQLQKNWGTLCSGVSYGAGASINHQDDSLYRPDYKGNWHPERWQTELHEQYYPYINKAEYLWGWFISNMFDYGAAGRAWGDGTGIEDRGLVTFDRKYNKDAFYFYKANWNQADKFVYIAEKRWINRTKEIQTLKVFSNEPEVELFLNGISLGVQLPLNGTFKWIDILMPKGDNVIEARSGSHYDKTVISIAKSPITVK